MVGSGSGTQSAAGIAQHVFMSGAAKGKHGAMVLGKENLARRSRRVAADTSFRPASWQPHSLPSFAVYMELTVH